MANPIQVSHDFGTGLGVLNTSQGGVSVYQVTTGTAFGSNIQIKNTGVTAPSGTAGTGPAWLAKVVNGITAQTNTITFYDSPTSAGCTAANAVYTLVAAAANSPTVIDIPIFSGLWMQQSAAATGPLNIYFG